jgi:hypothetical protein
MIAENQKVEQEVVATVRQRRSKHVSTATDELLEAVLSTRSALRLNNKD